MSYFIKTRVLTAERIDSKTLKLEGKMKKLRVNGCAKVRQSRTSYIINFLHKVRNLRLHAKMYETHLSF